MGNFEVPDGSLSNEYPAEKEIKAEERAEAKVDTENGVLKLGGGKNSWKPKNRYAPKEDYKVYEVSLTDLSLHDIANEHPKQTEIEYQRLKESIYDNGQLEPILIYRGKIVDGRHRYWAMKDLGIKAIACKELPFSTSLEDIKEIVFSTEVRRHQTKTQLAIKGWWATQEDGLTYREAEEKFMTSKTQIGHCKYISDKRGNDMLIDLYNNKPVAIGIRTSTNIASVRKLIQDEEATKLKARMSVEKSISDDEIFKIGDKYLRGLDGENTLIIEYVSKKAFQILKDRTS